MYGLYLWLVGTLVHSVYPVKWGKLSFILYFSCSCLQFLVIGSTPRYAYFLLILSLYTAMVMQTHSADLSLSHTHGIWWPLRNIQRNWSWFTCCCIFLNFLFYVNCTKLLYNLHVTTSEPIYFGFDGMPPHWNYCELFKLWANCCRLLLPLTLLLLVVLWFVSLNVVESNQAN